LSPFFIIMALIKLNQHYQWTWVEKWLVKLDSLAKGGPFKNYTVYDSTSQRIYMIDFAVFDPGKPKLHLMKKLDAIAHTFVFPLSDEKQ